MNQTQLRAFMAVAEAGSFTSGAEKLMVSQPAVSLQVAELEKALGAKLLDRGARAVSLTEAGKILLGYARRISAMESEAESAVTELSGLGRGRLSVGASLTVGSYVLPPVLGEFRRRFPRVIVELEIANTAVIEQKLLDNQFDVGFTEGLAEQKQLVSRTYAADHLVAVCPPGHELQKHKRVTAAMVGREPLIFRERGSGTREVVEAALRRKGIVAEPVMSLGSTEAIKRAVMAGIGIAIVSELAIAAELAAGMLVVVPMSDLQIRRPLHLLELRGKSRSRAAAEFLKISPLELGNGALQ